MSRGATRGRSVVAGVIRGSLALLLGCFVLGGVASAQGTRRGGADDPPTGATGASEAEREVEAQRRERAVIERFLRSKLDEARELYRRRQYQGAYRIADAILTLEPEVSFRQEVRRLRRAAEARHLAKTVVLVTFEPKGGAGFPVERLDGTIVVENLGQDPLTVGLGAESTLGLLEYTLFEFYGDGSEWTTQGTVVVHGEEDFQLASGDARRLHFSTEIPRGRGTPVMQYFSVAGMLRPRSLESGDEFIARNVPWDSTEVLLLAEDLESLRADPWKTLVEAYEAYDSRRVAASGFYWIWELKQMGEPGSERRDETIDFLLAQLDPEVDQGLDRLTMRLLEQVTGKNLKPTKETWFRWARRRE